MADQASSGTVPDLPSDGGPLGPAAAAHQANAAFHGRAVSWVAVSIIMAGFLAGGAGLVFGPLWWLFWAGAGMVAVGGLLALVTNIFEDWY